MDRTNRIVDIVQLVTGLAVVIGIGLVVWELQQSKALARAQLASDHFAEALANRRARLGENPMHAIVKACLYPENLTPEERAIALADLDSKYDLITRNKTLSELGRFDIPWQKQSEPVLRQILGTPLGRYDYENYRDARWMPELHPIMDRILENNEQVECKTFWDGFDEWIHDRTDDAPSTGSP
jgi:GAF domain-containing protein